MHLKLDELIRAVGHARNRLVHLEDLSDADLAKLEEEFKKLHDTVERRFEEHEKKEQ
jgi:low affinity Fe/Cu permease